MSEHRCSYCEIIFTLPNENFIWLKHGGNGSNIFLETRGRTKLIHRLESAKRTAQIKKRAEQKFQLLKKETNAKPINVQKESA